LKDGYIASRIDEATAQTAESDAHGMSERVASLDAVASTYALVRPMKAALYFDSVNSFGEWRIMISSKADRYLRLTHKKSPDTFRIVVKKME
jgi:hypothetical protein